MSNEALVCAREDCNIEFDKKTHNQKYCSDECCRIATNRRLMERYYAKRARRAGEERVCSVCEVTKLSRYNASDTCGSCEAKRETELKDSIVNMFSNTNLSM